MSPEPILTTSFNNSEKATLLIGFVLGLFFLRNVGTKAAILLELMGAESTYNCSNPLFHTEEEEGDTPSPTSTPKTTCERWQLVCSTSSYFADKKGSIHVCVAILKCSRLMALPL